MKCPSCEGKMEPKESTLDGITYRFHSCTSCGEELLDMKQLGKLAGKYRKLRKSKDVTFSKWGNSLAVRIPKDIADELGIKEGSQGLITKEKDGLKIIPG